MLPASANAAMPSFTIITPNYNGAVYLSQCIESVLAQRQDGMQVQYILIDGASTDASLAVADRYRDQIDIVVSEPDRGPADAINKGLRRAEGDVVAWLNADDVYYPGTLRRVAAIAAAQPERALWFGRCPIVNEQGDEIRRGITRFKEFFFPLSCQFTIQSINYISQPAMFFRRSALEAAGLLRQDLKAAWDYAFILRLWRQGGGVVIPGGPLAAFRWHPGSISGQHFRQQFQEEYDVAVADAGRLSLPVLLHWGVRWGIVGAYSLMAWQRERR
jgi:glycosyltransferase involved in cell wall biosynthesis